MKAVFDGNRAYITDISYISLKDTLDCGQCFRWKECEDKSWEGIVKGEFCSALTEGDALILEGITEESFWGLWCDYFDLERDYKALINTFSQDELLRRACLYAPGIRLLKQDPWEAFISFIISQNNNITRIRGLIEKLCFEYGEKKNKGYAFPTPKALADVSVNEYSSLGFGYRAEYLSTASKAVASGEFSLDELISLSTEEAKKRLMQIKGIGPKVADCVLLFGLGKMECCPADVWMKRVLAAYGGKLPPCTKGAEGPAQQFLFHYVRNNPGALDL